MECWLYTAQKHSLLQICRHLPLLHQKYLSRASPAQPCSHRGRTCPKAEAVAPNGLVWPNAGACCPNGEGEVLPKGLEEAPKPANGKGRVPINRRRPAGSQRDACSCPCTEGEVCMPSKAQTAPSSLPTRSVKAHLPLQSQNSWRRALWIRGPPVQVWQGLQEPAAPLSLSSSSHCLNWGRSSCSFEMDVTRQRYAERA